MAEWNSTKSEAVAQGLNAPAELGSDVTTGFSRLHWGRRDDGIGPVSCFLSALYESMWRRVSFRVDS
jgi:hypothetical protein